MKNAKKLLAILLVVMMSLALAVPAFAATYTLTINGAPANHTFSAYQIFKGTLDTSTGKLSNIAWGTGFDTSKVSSLVTDLKAKFTSNTAIQALTTSSNAETIAKAISSITTNSADAAKLADIFAKYTSSTKTDSTVSGSSYKIAVDDGYYLIKDTSTNTADGDKISDFIMRVVKTETVSVKGEIPTVDKKISTDNGSNYVDGPANVKVGDILDYEIIGTLPSNYADYVKYYMEFRDNPDGDIALKTTAGTYKVYVDNGGTLTEVKSDCYTATVSATSLNVKITNTKDLKNTSGAAISTTKASKIVVKYQAEVLSSTTPGTYDVNSADIVYSKNPNWDGSGTPETGETPPDEVKTVTQSFKFVKFDGADNKLLAGATFQIKQGSTVINLVKVSNTEYKVADSDDANKVTTFTSVATGAITIKGLDADVTYTLHETAAPAGYNTAADITFKVSAATTTATPSITSGVYTTTTNVVGVANNSGTVLPATGGMGTVLFITFGAIVAMAAGIVLTAKKRLYNEG